MSRSYHDASAGATPATRRATRAGARQPAAGPGAAAAERSPERENQVLRPLQIVQDAPDTFFNQEHGRHATFSVFVRAARAVSDLRVTLMYATGGAVDNQAMLRHMVAGAVVPLPALAAGEPTELSFRCEEVSRAHGGKKFRLRIESEALGAGVTSAAFVVLSKLSHGRKKKRKAPAAAAAAAAAPGPAAEVVEKAEVSAGPSQLELDSMALLFALEQRAGGCPACGLAGGHHAACPLDALVGRLRAAGAEPGPVELPTPPPPPVKRQCRSAPLPLGASPPHRSPVQPMDVDALAYDALQLFAGEGGMAGFDTPPSSPDFLWEDGESSDGWMSP